MRVILFSAALFILSFTVKSQNITKAIEDGHSIVYYKNGKIKSIGNYVNNQREGEWLYFHENGKVAIKKNFSNGTQVGEWSYYNEKGNLVIKVDDISKLEEKTQVTLYDNNEVKGKATFVNGKRVGDWNKPDKIDLNNKF